MSDETGKKKGGITPLSFLGSLFAGWFGVLGNINECEVLLSDFNSNMKSIMISDGC